MARERRPSSVGSLALTENRGSASVADLLLSLSAVLSSTAETRALFDRDFSLKYTVHLLPSALTVSLGVTSPSSSSSVLPFQALLHSYLRLPTSVSPPQVRVTPLNTLTFIDKVTGGKEGKEDREVVEVQGPKGEVDRVYYHAPNVLEIKYEGASGSMKITKEHLDDVVVSLVVSLGSANRLADLFLSNSSGTPDPRREPPLVTWRKEELIATSASSPDRSLP
jgi:hypothetical protein